MQNHKGFQVGDIVKVSEYPPEPEMVGKVGSVVSIGKGWNKKRVSRGMNGICVKFDPPAKTSHSTTIHNVFHRWELVNI